MREEDYPDPDATRTLGVAGRPAILADGREWSIATPRHYLRPVFAGDGSVATESRYGYRGAADRAAQDFLAAVRGAGPIPYALAAAAGIELVRLCHAITAAEAAALLELDAEAADAFMVDLAYAVLGCDSAPSVAPAAGPPAAQDLARGLAAEDLAGDGL